MSRSAIVPENEVAEATHAFSNDKIDETEMENLFCIGICNGSNVSINEKVPVYDKDKTFIMRSMCHDCVLSLFQNSTNQFFIDQELKLDNIAEFPVFPVKPENSYKEDDIEWPQIPLGRLFMVLIKDKDIAPYLQAWISGRIHAGIRFSGRCISCPIHDKQMYFIDMEKDPNDRTKKKPKTFKCPVPDCDFIFDCESSMAQN